VRWLALLALVLAGCGGGSAPAPEPPGDPQLARSERVARLAFSQRQLEDAARSYRDALDKAYARDDLGAIGDNGFSLAVVELRRGRTDEALKVIRSTGAELARRGRAAPLDLRLVEATALYRAGDAAGAAALAEELARGSGEVASRAQFLRGTIAADRNDAEAVATVIAALGTPTVPELKADVGELTGRRALLLGDRETAKRALVGAADLRRDGLDYAGMARALALAAQAAEGGEAAGYYLRAGRTAVLVGAKDDARRWLAEAKRLGDTAVVAEAELWIGRIRN
jgi:hypothetical protein